MADDLLLKTKDGVLSNTQAKPVDLLAELLEGVRAKHKMPALAGAIVKQGKLVALGAVGERARGSGVRVMLNDLWHLGSCTKAMTATVAARLVERGTLCWDASVEQELAKEKKKTEIDPGWKSATLELLLGHRPGVRPRSCGRRFGRAAA